MSNLTYLSLDQPVNLQVIRQTESRGDERAEFWRGTPFIYDAWREGPYLVQCIASGEDPGVTDFFYNHPSALGLERSEPTDEKKYFMS
ncbi:MAG TPA: hypothetical protein VJL56_06375 [Candidatus Bathyarchaeia archaeon]|nr:hypothetical protein [Candidatus Bathyarchaeia archaeon]